ncbi:MAG: hypothetical protein NVS1B13_19900 [Flavisolibacter sp.]
MKKIIAPLFIITTVLVACQKEVSYTATGVGLPNTTPGNLLVKTVSQTPNDSSITLYQYDLSKRLTGETVSGTVKGGDATSDLRIFRNAEGTITKTVQVKPSLGGMGMDSLTTTVLFDGATSRSRGTLQNISSNGTVLVDSTLFLYDPSNKVVEQDVYQKNAGASFLISKTEFSYTQTGTDLAVERIFVAGTDGNLTLIATVDFSYDDKVNPLWLSNSDAFALQQPHLCSAHNLLSLHLDDRSDPLNSFVYSVKYNGYNIDNRPTGAVTTLSLGNIVTHLSYYYQ